MSRPHSPQTCTTNKRQLPVAESLCMPCLDARRPTSTPLTRNQAIGRAWWHLEYAIATPDHNDAMTAVAQAQEFCEASNGLPGATFKIGLFKAILPAMLDRVEGKPLQPASKLHANQNFGELLGKLRSPSPARRAGMRAEALTAYLLSREGVDDSNFLYVASPREEAGKNKPFNHDSYQLGGSLETKLNKFPLQVKAGTTNEHYEVPIIPVTVALQPVLKRLEGNGMTSLAEMALSEAEGHDSEYTQTLLGYASHCLQSYISDRRYETILDDLAPIPLQET